MLYDKKYSFKKLAYLKKLLDAKNWLAVLNAGKRLQIKRLLLRDNFNFSALPLYISKATSLIKNYLSKRF